MTANVLVQCNYSFLFIILIPCADSDFDFILRHPEPLLVLTRTMRDTGISAPIAKDPSTKIEGSGYAYRTSKSNEDSRNLDVVLRNGLAGGVAGCAVSFTT